MGCGKTTVGKILANEFEYQFVDLDQMIEKNANACIQDIFKNLGEEEFRKMEHQSLLELSGSNNQVVATGGGAPCFFDNMEIMNNSGITVYIKMTPLELTHRLINLPLESREKRPLIARKDENEILEYIEKTLEIREPVYSIAKVITLGHTMSPENLANRIKNALDCVNMH